MGKPLPDRAKTYIDGPNLATLGTVGRDGTPQLTPRWIGRDGDDLLMSTVVGRQAELNLRENNRVSVSIIDPDDPYKYVEIRGRASVTEEGGRELIDAFAKKYRGLDVYPWDKPGAVRVVVRVPADHIVLH
jgi:PPOX class probable F420-dependent enzyme